MTTPEKNGLTMTMTFGEKPIAFAWSSSMQQHRPIGKTGGCSFIALPPCYEGLGYDHSTPLLPSAKQRPTIPNQAARAQDTPVTTWDPRDEWEDRFMTQQASQEKISDSDCSMEWRWLKETHGQWLNTAKFSDATKKWLSTIQLLSLLSLDNSFISTNFHHRTHVPSTSTSIALLPCLLLKWPRRPRRNLSRLAPHLPSPA